jgi:hypothetical protein
MGYLLRAGEGSGRHSAVSVTDAVWLDVIQTASKRGYSNPELRRERNEERPIDAQDAAELAGALDRALVAGDIGTHIGEGDALDHDVARRMVYILRAPEREGVEVSLARTPPWKSGDELAGQRS